ncbi:MAG TPA: metallophosphoesterase [Pirellulales bacterium]|nr:metallophosphoesterase [Pirellulales bacterium]
MRSTQKLAIIGDLHYELPQDSAYRAAREQILRFAPDTIFQLGDQGGYSHCGSWQSFEEGLDFLQGFDRPFHTLMGNHDLEGRDYATDAEAVAAWCEAFGASRPYHEVDLGDALGICLSSTRFRANTGCCHEVHLDDAQIAWLAATLKRHRRRPTFVFSHAPIIGSGLRVLQSIHLKCPNAWLNHTDRPERFIEIVHKNPQIKLWFSAHNHLGQRYPDSFSQVGRCTFVHTGVIGEVSRDGCHHSRFVEFDAAGFQLSTVDHETGELTANLRHDYATGKSDVLSPHTATEAAIHFSPPPFPTGRDRLQLGQSVFALHRGMLVEYDVSLQAPVGVVTEDLRDEIPRVRSGELQLVDSRGTVRVLWPNAKGRWSQVFEPNPRFEKRRSA